MPYTMFHGLFPDVANKEIRAVAVNRSDALPLGTYAFVEMYCDETQCDCRRVLVRAAYVDGPSSHAFTDAFATMSFGWETPAFYQKWAGYPLSKDDLLDLKGPALPRLTEQSQYAPALLELFKTALQDTAYVERIKRHYKMYRDVIDAQTPPKIVSAAPKLGPNLPCFCGSGVKYKKCCYNRA